MPELSIIMPVYRSYPRMIECIDSILAQTFTDFELILIDDCTPDIESKNYCDEIAQKDNRIKVFHLDRNRGIAGARNFGLEQATGEFIHFSDADDFVAPTMYECMILKIKQEKTNLAISPTLFTYKESITLEKIKEGLYSTKETIWEFIKSRNFHPVWNKIYLLNIINHHNIRFNPLIITADDAEFNFKYFTHCKKISAFAEPFYHWYTNWSKNQASFKEQNFISIQILLSSYFTMYKHFSDNSKIDQYCFSSFFYRSTVSMLGTQKTYNVENIQNIINLRNKFTETLTPPLFSKNLKLYVISICIYFKFYFILKLILKSYHLIKKR